MSNDNERVLSVGELTVSVAVAVAHRSLIVAGELAAYTRSAPITSGEMLQYALRRVETARSRKQSSTPVVYVGDDPIVASEDHRYIGKSACWICDARDYAKVRPTCRFLTA